MKKSVIIVTGCDANFYHYMQQALASIFAADLNEKADIGILDLGLLPQQITELKSMGCKIIVPEWTLPVPEHKRIKRELGLVARTALREYFTGYQIYLWFDADAWVQTPEFFDYFITGAKQKGAAIVREDGYGYRRNLLYNKWHYGHMIASYGIIDGVKVAYKPTINIGIVALLDTAPHWNAWINHYTNMIVKRGKTNLDQHAFNAAIELDSLPSAHIPATNNWIATLSSPLWNEETKLLCEPDKQKKPLSIIHLAGPDKDRIYHLKAGKRTLVDTSLTYPSILRLKEKNI